jgi:hypothetical protein
MHPLDELWSSVDNELPDSWVFDGVSRGLLLWIATAVNYSGVEHRIVRGVSKSPIEAVQKMIAATKRENHG